MKLRTKLLTPILGSLFACFLFAFVFVDCAQTKKMRTDMAAKIEEMSEYIAISNAAYVWNIDTAGLGASLSAFLKDRAKRPHPGGLQGRQINRGCSSGNSRSRRKRSSR